MPQEEIDALQLEILEEWLIDHASWKPKGQIHLSGITIEELLNNPLTTQRMWLHHVQTARTVNEQQD